MIKTGSWRKACARRDYRRRNSRLPGRDSRKVALARKVSRNTTAQRVGLREPKGRLEGRHKEIDAAGDRKLEAAREPRRQRRANPEVTP
jgi:hypothetical protein